MLLVAWPSLLFADNWTYVVADNYDNTTPEWLTMCKATNKSGSITPTSKTPTDGIGAITWEYNTTMSSTDINAQKDGTAPKGIKLGSADHPMDITFFTKAFAGKKITKATIVIKSLSKKCQYKVTATNGVSYTKENVLNQNNSGSANTKGEASFDFNTVAGEFSFQVTSTGTTSNTKGGFGFVSISIDYTDDDTPVTPAKTPVELKWGGVRRLRVYA